MGANFSKRYSSLKSLYNILKILLNFLFDRPHKSAVFNISNFGFLIFSDFLKFNIVPYRETKSFNYLGNE